MSRPASRQPPPEKPERVRPVVEHIIDDHAGTGESSRFRKSRDQLAHSAQQEQQHEQHEQQQQQ